MVIMEFIPALKLTGLPFLAYVIGSIPWGIMLTRIFTSEDIRKKGSGNIGATNVLRIAGVKLGLLTLTGDLLKGAIPVWLGLIITDPNDCWRDIYIALISLSAVSGHLFPVFLKFKGGKGVATTAGCFLVASPTAFFISLLVFILCIFYTNHMSAGSLASITVLPVAVWVTTGSWAITGCAIIIMIFIYIRHQDNIRRLVSGKERTLWVKKNK